MRESTIETLRWLRGRAMLLVAAVAAIGLVTTGTHAMWTGDDVTSTTGTFTAGTVDLGVGPDAAHDHTVTIPGGVMWPGETRQVPVLLTNTGSLPVDYTTTVTKPGTLGPALATSGIPASGSLAAGESTTLTISVTFDTTRITSPTGAGSLQGATGSVVVAFDAQNQ